MSAIELQFSNAVAKAVAAASPSVVRLEARGRRGSSAIVWQDGFIVTADHTVEREEEIVVETADGTRRSAKLVGRDPAVDLAVLQVDGGGLTPATWSDAADLQVGHVAVAIGRPGRHVRASLGIIAALGDSWRTPAGGKLERRLQPDIGLYPGFSGSLLVDLQGRALGMNTSGLQRGTALTIPTPALRRITSEILAHGTTRRGFLGIGALPVRLTQAFEGATRQPTALLVVSVQPGSPADRAGVLLGDLLYELANQKLGSIRDLFAALDEAPAGTATAARILRGGVPQELPITVGSRAA